MATIGGESCSFVKMITYQGRVTRARTWERRGINGTGAMTEGEGKGLFAFRGVLFDSDSNVETWRGTIEAMQGTIISIVDDNANTYSNCFVKAVAQFAKAPVIESGTSKFRAQLVVSGEVLAS